MTKKNSKDLSYTSRAGAKVSYPKLKLKDKTNDTCVDGHRNGEDESSYPSKDDILNLISSSPTLSKGTLRYELFKIIDEFLKRNSV